MVCESQRAYEISFLIDIEKSLHYSTLKLRLFHRIATENYLNYTVTHVNFSYHHPIDSAINPYHCFNIMYFGEIFSIRNSTLGVENWKGCLKLDLLCLFSLKVKIDFWKNAFCLYIFSYVFLLSFQWNEWIAQDTQESKNICAFIKIRYIICNSYKWAATNLTIIINRKNTFFWSILFLQGLQSE